MRFLNWFREKPPAEMTAPVARERLQVLLAHERASPGQANLLGAIKDDILAAIRRHVTVDTGDVHVKLEKRKAVSTMRIAVDLPK